MLRMLAVVRVAVAAGLLALPAAAQEVEANIVTGGPAGTYIQIGRDLAKLGESAA